VTPRSSGETQLDTPFAQLLDEATALNALFDTAAAAILITTADGEIRLANACAARIFGFQSNVEMIGHRMQEFYVDPSDRQRLLAIYAGPDAQDRTVTGPQLRLRRRDGAPLTLGVSGRVLSATADRPTLFISHLTDVTELQQALEQAQASEARYHRAERATSDALWEKNLQSRTIYFSPRGLALLGYASGELTLSLAAFVELLHPDDRERANAAFTDAVASGNPYDVEYRLRKKDGSYLWVHVRGHVEFSPEDGSPQRLTGSMADISSRKAGEAALAFQLSRYERAGRASNDGPWELDVAAKEEFVSDRWLALLGYDAGEWPSAMVSTFSLIHPDDAPRTQEVIRAHASSGEPYTHECRFRRKDGTYVWMRVRGAADLGADGRPAYLTAAVTDIGAERQAFEELSASDARYRRAQRASADGLWEWNIPTGHNYFSSRFLSLLGYGPGELREHVDTFFSLVHVDDLADVRAAVEAHLATGALYDREFRLRRKDGSYLWVHTRGQVERTADGTPSRMTGSISDISGRKLAEAALRQSEARLLAAQDAALLGNWKLDLTTGALHWSELIFKIFEVDREQFGASYPAFLAAIHPEDRDMVDRAYQASLRDRSPYRVVHRLQMSDGRVKWVEERCESDFAADGTPLKSCGVVQDVTEREKQASALRALVHEKEVLVREVHHRVKNNLQVVSSLLHF
jgi:PAS domain S-box-containing protein